MRERFDGGGVEAGEALIVDSLRQQLKTLECVERSGLNTDGQSHERI